MSKSNSSQCLGFVDLPLHMCLEGFRIIVEFISSIWTAVWVYCLGMWCDLTVPVFCIPRVHLTHKSWERPAWRLTAEATFCLLCPEGNWTLRLHRPRIKETSTGRGSGILGTKRGAGMVFYQDFLWQLVYLTHLLADFSIVLMEDVYQTINLERQFLFPLAWLNCPYQWNMERLHMCSVCSPPFSSPVSFRLTLLTCMYERELLVLFWSKLVVLLKD